MYILYEDYSDEVRNMKDTNINTRIIGVFENKEIAKTLCDDLVNKTIEEVGKYDWFVKEIKEDFLYSNNKIIRAYEVFNEEIDNCFERYLIILEKVEVIKNV